MRTPGSSDELERRRHLAVQRVCEGYPIEEVADFLGVHRTTVSRWVAVFRAQGLSGLAVRPATGRPPKLTRAQEKVIRRWLADKPTGCAWRPCRLGHRCSTRPNRCGVGSNRSLVQLRPARCSPTQWRGGRGIGGGQRRSGVLARLVPCFGTSSAACITFLTCCN
jgi:hypothetical protein